MPSNMFKAFIKSRNANTVKKYEKFFNSILFSTKEKLISDIINLLSTKTKIVTKTNAILIYN